MPLGSLDRENLTSIPFDELSGYEKGAVARAFLGKLIKHGNLEKDPSDSCPGEISFSIQQWELTLLAYFCEEDEPMADNDDQEILLDELCQLR